MVESVGRTQLKMECAPIGELVVVLLYVCSGPDSILHVSVTYSAWRY
jgi:hypothetical protein